jgi:hypothetical protein
MVSIAGKPHQRARATAGTTNFAGNFRYRFMLD